MVALAEEIEEVSSRSLTTVVMSVLVLFGRAPTRAPSRAAVVMMLETIMARPNSIEPRTRATRTGAIAAISTVAAPRRRRSGRPGRSDRAAERSAGARRITLTSRPLGPGGLCPGRDPAHPTAGAGPVRAARRPTARSGRPG